MTLHGSPVAGRRKITEIAVQQSPVKKTWTGRDGVVGRGFDELIIDGQRELLVSANAY